MTKHTTHLEFQDRLIKSEPWRWHGARVLVSLGHTVTIRPSSVAPTFEERAAYSDKGDVIVYDRVVEIKHIEANFTCREDWPFRDYIVEGEANIVKNDPMWIITFNPTGTHYGFVDGKTRPQWRVEPRTARERGHTTLFYICDLDCVTFHKVEE